MVQPRQRNALFERGAVRRNGAIEIPLRTLEPPLDDEPLESQRREAPRIRGPEVQCKRHELRGARDIPSLQLRIRKLLPGERDRLRIGFRPGLLQESFEQRHLPLEILERSVEVAECLDHLAGEIRIVPILAQHALSAAIEHLLRRGRLAPMLRKPRPGTDW